MVTELLKKYLWLIQSLIRAGDRGLTLDEISRRHENRFGGEYPRRSFNNHRRDIAEIFNVEIVCNRADNTYSIPFADDVTDENAASAWLINTFTVNNMLTLGKERLSGRVSVEDIPSGHRWLTLIMDAMLSGHALSVAYRKYASPDDSRYTLHPYALKESSKRWYLVAWCEQRAALRVYGLDRIRSIEITPDSFTVPSGFDVDELFATCFGVYLPESSPRTILLRADPRDAEYLRDLPIHPSQKELPDDGKGPVFSIFVRPNRSLLMEILKYGPGIEVLSPDSVREEIASMLRSAVKQYENK